MEVMLLKTDTNISEMSCCSTYKFFTNDDKELRRNMRVIISVPNRTKKNFISNYYRFDHSEKFKYDGNFVCSNFLLESFRFSRDLETSTKEDIY